MSTLVSSVVLVTKSDEDSLVTDPNVQLPQSIIEKSSRLLFSFVRHNRYEAIESLLEEQHGLIG